MTLMMFLLLLFLLAGLLYALLMRPVGRWRGQRIVTCPANDKPAAVEVDSLHAALSRWSGAQGLQLKACSRQPGRPTCGQHCLAEIAAAPEDCLVRTVVTRWYDGKTCALCGSRFRAIHWLEHEPALLTPASDTVQWSDVRAERLPEVLATHRAVCWNCHVAETFRRQYPDLIVDRGGTHVRTH
jgi:hypothetical protein